MARGHVCSRVRVTLPVVGPVLVLILALTLAGCGGDDDRPSYDPEATGKQIAAAVAAGLPSPKLTVLGELPHSTDAWTEGLEIAQGKLYEGTGLVGRSELRELDPKTGELIRATALPPGLYGEGITVVDSLIWQLTYRDGVLLQWDRATLNSGGRVPWTGEGWGLCHNSGAGELVASDGTDRLRVIDSNGTEQVQSIRVTLKGRPLPGLNELECVTKKIMANVFGTTWIVAIDPATGEVTSAVDAAKLVPKNLRGNPDQVLNGIAAVPGTNDTFLLTGKFWPTLYRVRIGSGTPVAAPR